MKPEISIVMSTYNESIEELKKAIDSMLNQTFENFEFLIILDNPKNEKHIEILEYYAKKDKRIKIIYNKENLGLAQSLNIGIDNSSGVYIARMDADDISELERLELQYNYLKENPEIDIVSTNKVDIDENDNVINVASKLPTEDKKIKKILKIASIINHSGAMMKKESILKIGKYRLFPASQDYDLWLRASYYNLNFAIIDKPLIRYRIRQNNITNTNPLKQYLLKEYIKDLYIQRIKYGEDNFSLEELEKYLQQKKAFDQTKIKKFKKDLEYLNQLKIKLKNKELLSTIKYALKIICSSSDVKNVFFDYIKLYYLKERS